MRRRRLSGCQIPGKPKWRQGMWAFKPAGRSALAAGELGNLLGVHVEAEDGEALLDEGEGEREADVAEADDADEGVVGADLPETLNSHGAGRGFGH